MSLIRGNGLFLEKQGREILSNLDFDFNGGELVTLVGPSGAGKSTFLTLLNRLIDPVKGEISFHDRPFTEYKVPELRRRIGLVMQQAVLFPGTVEDNIRYGPALAGIKEIESIGSFLELAGLPSSYLDRSVDNLSGGEKQRVSLARTLANNPEVILLDEPTSALDPGAAEIIEKTVVSLNKQKGALIIWVTHNLEQAKRVGTRTILISKGKIIENRSTADFFAQPENELTKRFLAGENLAEEG